MRHRPSVIAQTGLRVVFHTLVLLSVYLLAAGHNAPGGGFVGGLVAGAALILVWAVDGPRRLRATLPVPTFTLIGLGLLAAIASAGLPWVQGRPFFENTVVGVTLPLFGEVKLTSVFLFDAGVYLVVLGMVMGTLVNLGDEVEP